MILRVNCKHSEFTAANYMKAAGKTTEKAYSVNRDLLAAGVTGRDNGVTILINQFPQKDN